MENQEYLIHYGVKGMKWGVRKDRNKDVALANRGKKRLSRRLQREYKKANWSGSSYKKLVESELSKVVTNEDRKRISDSLKRAKQLSKGYQDIEDTLHKAAVDYGNKRYSVEIKKDKESYPTQRDKDRLLNTLIYEEGYTQARKQNPDLAERLQLADDAWDDYMSECRKVSDKLLGEYGNEPVYKNAGKTYTLRDSVDNIVIDLSSSGWKYKE